ncbi:MAG: nucleoside diphosphate kinase regulator [Peptococcaceae bacterium]|nr:nucleoside diphosphate kinase regulator [Peptococcaceae bacterium]
MSRQIFITEKDKIKLQKLINEAKEFHPSSEVYLNNLEQELDRAQLVDSQKVPHDVITMHSKVLLRDIDSGEEMIYTLVYPNEANIMEDKISVLAPVGTAIIGLREKDAIDWKIPSGMVRLEVKEILYQPEAAGDFDS